MWRSDEGKTGLLYLQADAGRAISSWAPHAHQTL